MKTKTINIALPEKLIQETDRVAKKEYRNRSELIRQALWTYLKNQMEWERLFRAGKKYGKKMGITSEADVDRIVYEFRHGKKS